MSRCGVVLALFMLLGCGISTATESPAADSVFTLLTNMDSAWANVHNYTCNMDVMVYKPDGAEVETLHQVQKFAFKKPTAYHVLQMGPFKEGGELVVTEQGVIRAHAGGLLSFIKVTLDRDSEHLKGITGENIFQSDFGYLIKTMHDLVPTARDLTVHPEGTGPDAPEILNATVPSTGTRWRMVVDQRTHMPIELERWNGDVKFYRIFWRDIRINVSIPAGEFEM